ncbi:hypothetical protein J4409_01125 [Candidatus Woesearchaeota archaeon]|nr:hypothetical protein [Candidatus Woesearchaeota archaeon]
MNTEKLLKLYAELKILVPLVVFALAILLMPYILRDNELSLMGREAYNYARIAESPISNYDGLSYGGRFLIFNAYPLVLSIASKIIGSDLILVSRIMPIFFGLIALVLFYFVLKKLEADGFTAILASIFLIISPPFIYMSTVSNVYIMPIVLLLAAFMLLLYNKKLIAYMVFSLTLFFGLTPFLISLALLSIYLIKSKNYKGLYLILILAMFLIPILKLGLPEFLEFTMLPEGVNFRIQTFIAEFGSETGLSMFAILLALFGLRQLWDEKYRHLAIYVVVFLLLVISFFEVKALMYLNFIAAFLVAKGVVRLIYGKWENVTINIIIGMLLVIGLISSLVFYIGFLSDALPNKEIIESFDFIKQESKENAVVFSYYTKGYWINYFGRRNNVMDESFFYAPNVNDRYYDSNTLFYTRNIGEAMKITEKYNIRYIWIDNAMKNGQVWKEEDEGLLFLLSTSKKFKREYYNNYVEIWKVVR